METPSLVDPVSPINVLPLNRVQRPKFASADGASIVAKESSVELVRIVMALLENVSVSLRLSAIPISFACRLQ